MLQINATRYFELSEVANRNYATTPSIDPSDLVNDKQVFVRFAAPSSASSDEVAGIIFFNIDPLQIFTVTAHLDGEFYVFPYQDDFNDPGLLILPNWQRFQGIGEQNWMITADQTALALPGSMVLLPHLKRIEHG